MVATRSNSTLGRTRTITPEWLKMFRVGYAPGAFDLFHIGHLNLLRNAKQRCDHLIAGVVADDIVLSVKGFLPVIPLEDRLKIVDSVKFVDAASAHTADDILAIWREKHFDVLFKGDDWQGTARGDRLERDLASVGVSVHYFPYTTSVSTTLLRKALLTAQAR